MIQACIIGKRELRSNNTVFKVNLLFLRNSKKYLDKTTSAYVKYTAIKTEKN